VSGAFLGAAVLGATVPWVHLAGSPGGGDSEPIAAFVTTMVAIPVGLASAVSLTVWVSRLARHRRISPPGLTWPGRRVGLVPTIGGVRVTF